jgi:hypothetical protein
MPHQLTPEIVAGAATIMATAWWYPPVAITEEALLNADKEARRFLDEWERLAHLVQSENDQEAIQPLMDHANRLLEYLTSSPVQSAATAAASMRILIRPECARSIKDGGPDDFHYTGFERILAWLEAAAAREGRHS